MAEKAKRLMSIYLTIEKLSLLKKSLENETIHFTVAKFVILLRKEFHEDLQH